MKEVDMDVLEVDSLDQLREVVRGYKQVTLFFADYSVGDRVWVNRFIGDLYHCAQGTLVSKFIWDGDNPSSTSFDGLGMPSCGHFILFDNGKRTESYINGNHFWKSIWFKKELKNLWGILIPSSVGHLGDISGYKILNVRINVRPVDY